MTSDRFAERPDPEVLLRQIQAAEQAESAGRLKILLGYGSGVGKSFRLFDEGRRRRARGQDVVVAAVQAQMPPDVEEIVRDLEQIPTLDINGVPVIDVAGVLRRKPQVCLVDGLAYDNPPGSRHPRRSDDVREIVGAGISVITTINLEYIDDQREFVKSVLGEASSGDVVDREFINRADEVEVVDATPDAAMPDRTRQLALLRPRALLVTADVVDRQLEAYLSLHGLQSSWGSQERILVAMTPRANAAAVLASGRRNADRLHGELFAVYVQQRELTEGDRAALARNELLARAQQAHFEVLHGRDPVKTLLAYAREHGITQIFVGHNLRRSWRNRLGGTPLDRLIRDAEGIDVRVFPH
jgi:two-component system sensor histidine kinase KdpD